MEITIENLLVETEEDAPTILAKYTGLSKTKIKDAMQKGAVWSDTSGKLKRIRRAKQKPPKGSTLSLYYSEKILEKTPQLPLLLDDRGECSVWIKQAGLYSNGSRFGDHCAINRVIEKDLDRPTFLVHRLDKPVWGIMVLAHTKQTATLLSEQFYQGKVEKVYKAVVTGSLSEEFTISHSLDGKDATSIVTPVDQVDNRSLIQIRILSGRKHQIRRHLSLIGHPVVGDHLYGDRDSGPKLLLASTALSFKEKNGNTVNHSLDESLHPHL